MVSLPTVRASNSDLPTQLTGVFVGATAGIGEYALKAFAKSVRHPRAYFIGRSQAAADRIQKECVELNRDGEYIFIRGDVSLMKVVDEVCEEVRGMERERDMDGKGINVLFQSQGTIDPSSETSESLPLIMALGYYSRIRFIINLIPLLQSTTTNPTPTIRRVILVFGGSLEGRINATNFPARNIGFLVRRDQLAAMLTLSLEKLAQIAPNVSFVHAFPGLVKTQGLQNVGGVVGFALKLMMPVLERVMCVPVGESGERHLFLGTGDRYVAREGGWGDTTDVARGTDGKLGSGVYSVNEQGESSGPKIEGILAEHRESGMREKVWEHTQGEFKRIVGH